MGRAIEVKKMSNVEADLFDLFLAGHSQCDLYSAVVQYIEAHSQKIISKENEEFLDNCISPLLTSINNAGWEDRHSSQIDVLWKAQSVAIDKMDVE